MTSTSASASGQKGFGLWHWLGLASAALVPGFLLALALSSLAVLLSPGAFKLYGSKHQLGMWSIGFLWLLIVAGVFLFRSGRSAWLWLGLANLVSYGALLFVRLCLS